LEIHIAKVKFFVYIYFFKCRYLKNIYSILLIFLNNLFLIEIKMQSEQQLMLDLRDAVVSSARVVNDNFGKSVEELGIEYKPRDGDTARTVIDRHAQDRMHGYLLPRYPNAVYNLEENDITDTSLEGKLQVFGDPFDGTANAQPKLPLSTQGLIAAENGEFAAAALHPFEKYVLYGAKNQGVFRAELAIDKSGEYYIMLGTERQLPPLEEVFIRLELGKDVMIAYVDAIYNTPNFECERKAKWKQLFVETFDKGYGGVFRNARMFREMGSNIDACMKLAEGRLHVQLTDNIGGIYDVAVGAVFLPLLGGVMTDMYGEPLQVPRNPKEMEILPQQVIIASIHPDIHERVIDITQECYGNDSEIYVPFKRKLVKVPEFTGFRDWDKANKAVYDSL
jgi:fructose-1,6-bisphosphatase/inositol monophosphatase family enzyme